MSKPINTNAIFQLSEILLSTKCLKLLIGWRRLRRFRRRFTLRGRRPRGHQDILWKAKHPEHPRLSLSAVKMQKSFHGNAFPVSLSFHGYFTNFLLRQTLVLMYGLGLRAMKQMRVGRFGLESSICLACQAHKLWFEPFIFCSTSVPLASTRWFWLTLSSLCPLF